jgi:hypothetical protein
MTSTTTMPVPDEIATMLRKMETDAGETKNPFALGVGEQLERLRAANREELWGFHESMFDYLAAHAPAWPVGRLAFRTLRIRFGMGEEGVATTFSEHVRRIRHVHGDDRVECWVELRPGVGRLRLLNGDDGHVPLLEWDVVDLTGDGQHPLAHGSRGRNALADELLVMAWLFPELIQAIDYNNVPALYAGGYELNVKDVSVGGSGSWRHIPRLSVDRHHPKKLLLNAIHIDNPEFRFREGHAMPRVIS